MIGPPFESDLPAVLVQAAAYKAERITALQADVVAHLRDAWARELPEYLRDLETHFLRNFVMDDPGRSRETLAWDIRRALTVNTLGTLQTDLDARIERLSFEITRILDAYMTEAYAEGYMTGLWDLEQAGLDVEVNLPDYNTALALILAAGVAGLSYRDRAVRWMNMAEDRINRWLKGAVTSEMPWADTIGPIRYFSDGLFKRLGGLGEEEAYRLQALGSHRAWGEYGDSIIGEVWVTQADERVCVSPRTLVMTVDGWKPAGRVVVGDLVLTHRDRFQPVTAVACRQYNGDWVRVDFGSRVRLSATSDHPVLTKRGWVPIGELRTDDSVSVLAAPCVCGELIPVSPDNSRRKLCYTCGVEKRNRAKWSRPGAREALIRRNRERWSPDFRARWRKKNSGRSPSLAVRRLLSDKAKQRYMDPAYYHRQVCHNRRTAQCASHPFRNRTPEQRADLTRKALQARGRKARGGTYIERKVAWFLESQGIQFETQWRFACGTKSGSAFADFYIPGANLVIECDGPLHLNPEATSRDRIKDAAHRVAERRVLRFTDSQIRQQFAGVASSIRECCCFVWLKPKTITSKTTRRQPVVDIQVQEDESFVAAGVVVHNCSICGPRHLTVTWQQPITHSHFSCRCWKIPILQQLTETPIDFETFVGSKMRYPPQYTGGEYWRPTPWLRRGGWYQENLWLREPFKGRV